MNLKNGKAFTSKFVGTGPSSYGKSIYRAAVSQRLRNTGLQPFYKNVYSILVSLRCYLALSGVSKYRGVFRVKNFKSFFLYCLTLKEKALLLFEISVTSDPTTAPYVKKVPESSATPLYQLIQILQLEHTLLPQKSIPNSA